jgi:hypothetical protein
MGQPMRQLAWTAWLLALALGCGRQGEGERCDRKNGTEGPDSDCADGLVCTESARLDTVSDICCPPEGQPATALACLGVPGTTTTTGVGGMGGMGGAGGGMGGAGGGMGGAGGGMGGAGGGMGGAGGGTGGAGGGGGGAGGGTGGTGG